MTAEVVSCYRLPASHLFSKRSTTPRKCLNKLVLLGESHLRAMIRGYLVYYHKERNHKGLGGLLILPSANRNRPGPLVCRERLGDFSASTIARRPERPDRVFAHCAVALHRALEQLHGVVRAKGQKNSEIRDAAARVTLDYDGHFTVDDLVKALRESGVADAHPATVYRSSDRLPLGATPRTSLRSERRSTPPGFRPLVVNARH